MHITNTTCSFHDAQWAAHSACVMASNCLPVIKIKSSWLNSYCCPQYKTYGHPYPQDLMGEILTTQHGSDLVGRCLAVLLQQVHLQPQEGIIHRAGLSLCCYVHILQCSAASGNMFRVHNAAILPCNVAKQSPTMHSPKRGADRIPVQSLHCNIADCHDSGSLGFVTLLCIHICC